MAGPPVRLTRLREAEETPNERVYQVTEGGKVLGTVQRSEDSHPYWLAHSGNTTTSALTKARAIAYLKSAHHGRRNA